MGVRNKYCSVCSIAEHQGKTASVHECYKNWTKSSTAMESDILVEGFNNSIQMHNLKYIRLIADGDSSVYSKIRENVTYGEEVQKIECVNHIMKNYKNDLYKVGI